MPDVKETVAILERVGWRRNQTKAYMYHSPDRRWVTTLDRAFTREPRPSEKAVAWIPPDLIIYAMQEEHACEV